MSWFAAVLAIAAATAIVLVPGLAVAAALKLRGLTALALAGPLGYGVVGLSGVLFGLMHIRFGWWAPVIVAAVVAAVIVGLRRVLGSRRAAAGTRRLPAWDSWQWRAVVPVAAAAIIASVAIGVIAFGAVPAADRISQTYDAVFHLNAAQSIVQGGNASSLQLYTLVHPTRTYSFYPAVWHSIVALTAEIAGVPVTVATNAAWIATAGPIWSLGCAFLAATLFGRVGVRGAEPTAAGRTLVATVAALLGSAFAAFPYLLLDFGTLYPNGLAYTMLPTGLALVAAVLPWPSRSAWQPDAPSPRWRVALLLVAWFGAAALSHPRSVVALAALGVPLLLSWFIARMRSLAESGTRGRRHARRYSAGLVVAVLVVAALAVVFIYHYYNVAHRPIADHLNGGPALARESFGPALLQGLLSTALVSPTQLPLPVPLLLAAVVLVGLVLLLFRRGLRWIVVAYLAIVVLYASAAGSNSDIAKLLTGLWDKDKFRIIAMLPAIAVPIAAWTLVAGGAEVAALMRRRTARRAQPRPGTVVLITVIAAVVVALTAWVGGTLGGVTQAVGTVFAMHASDKHGRLVDADETALLKEVGRYVPAGQVIVDDPWNGTALAWVLGGRQTLFPHLGGYWGTTRKTVAEHLNSYATDPAVCRAVRELKLHWLVSDPQKLWNGPKEAHAFIGIDRAAKGAGVERVASVGSTTLYRITACWP